ncbi:MAG: hypothetical protein EA339_02320 [Rhodobacteraceae bacterium]|nr:MAG: hypothetical protein EA339_02320 [Paracoccaceae bacterium]
MFLALVAPAGLADSVGAPQSAIEWLERALREPPPPAVAPSPPPQDAEDRAAPRLPDAHFEPIAVTPLSGATLETTGLFTAAQIGLPRDLWGPTSVADIIAAIKALPSDTLPSAARLSLRLFMAEFAPPVTDARTPDGALLLARIDRLIAMGALEQASQLIEAAPGTDASLRLRGFDIALLMGEEDRACETMVGQITATEGQGAQIFCMARRGNWRAAYSGLAVAQQLGLLPAAEAALLTRFLEEEENEFSPPPPQTITPLGLRILEALGEPVSTTSLPVAYAHVDLRGISGWRAQLDAAERLTRSMALQPNRLFGLYTERRAAASGGLWERVRAVQSLERARASGDTELVSETLIRAYPLFQAVELESAFAEIHAESLADLELNSEASRILWEILLLAQDRVDRAVALTPDTSLGRFIAALASGAPLPETTSPATANAIALGFSDDDLPASLQDQLDRGAFGMVLLQALDQIALAAAGDLQAATQGLRQLRAVGLDAVARQIAIEILLLERRG